MHIMLAAAGAIALMMVLVWAISVVMKDTSIVDIAWGLGLVLVSWVAYSRAHNRLVLPILTSIWGVRLALYLAWRNLGHGEDKRYVAIRRQAGEGFWWKSLFIVFALQGVLMWIVSLPVQLGQLHRPSLRYAGIVLWAIGFAFESIGDYQLARFKLGGGSGIMDRGLWKYTRHPNYFGDFCVWWGLYLTSGAWWSIFGPILMTILLMKVSGAALLERTIVKRRPEYEDYIRRTSAFFPAPPRKA